MTTSQTIIENLRVKLPAIFTRKDTPHLIGRIYAYQTLANLDSQKQGPPATRLGKRVIYERESFLTWLESRMGV